MSPQQEAKFDRLYDLVNDIHGDMKVVKNNQEIHATTLLEHEQKHLSIEKDLSSIKGDRNKVIGALWLGGSTLGLGTLHFVISWLNKFK